MNRIKELRLKKGLKQSELAVLVNAKQGTISHWENEVTEVDRQSLFFLADYFGVSTDYLLGKSDSPDPAKLTIPPELEGINVAFNRDEFHDLTQAEVEILANLAKSLKEKGRL